MKILKQHIQIFLLVLTLLGNVAIVNPAPVFAAAGSDGIDNAELCKDINPPTTNLEGKLVTILEERMNPQGKLGDNSMLVNCFRKTSCTKTDKGRDCTKPQYVDKCTPDDATICQPIQALIAANGTAVLYSYIGFVYRWAAGIIGLVSVLYLVYGGLRMAAAGGDSEKVNKAKEHIMNSIAGLVLLFLSALILYTINPNFFTLT